MVRLTVDISKTSYRHGEGASDIQALERWDRHLHRVHVMTPPRQIKLRDWTEWKNAQIQDLANKHGPKFPGHRHVADIPFGCARPIQWLALQDRLATYGSSREILRSPLHKDMDKNFMKRVLLTMGMCRMQQQKCCDPAMDTGVSPDGPKNFRPFRYGARLRFLKMQAR